MPLHQSPRRARKEAVTHNRWPDSLDVKDAVEGRYDACDVQPIELSWPAGSPGAPPYSEPDQLPRSICSEQYLAISSDAGGEFSAPILMMGTGPPQKSAQL